ncbi:hypothetical protein CEXT_514171 [Caerostris extrusa]|uniref:Uncharacterized protein n=1 Tax=Caerostris extrusa TaxID=172846 RepID=A0AAV4TUP5_CAEEX|nr:hypothetical protein CEXT_514171 [Caerostris extrusa]
MAETWGKKTEKVICRHDDYFSRKHLQLPMEHEDRIKLMNSLKRDKRSEKEIRTSVRERELADEQKAKETLKSSRTKIFEPEIKFSLAHKIRNFLKERKSEERKNYLHEMSRRYPEQDLHFNFPLNS